MENKKLIVPIIAVIISIVAFMIVIFGVNDKKIGSAPPGLASTVATSGPMAVNTTASTVLATSTNCASRIITSYASPIMITFNDADGDTPSGVLGHLQSASTTQVYDSGLYGCGGMKVYSFTTQTITVSETR